MGLCNTKSLNKPARTTKTKYYENGDVKSVTFYSNKKIHREQESKAIPNLNSSEPNSSEPAFISYFPGNRLQTRQWFKNGILHRDGDNPAEIWYYENGSIQRQKHYKNGILHRDGDNPAEIWYYEDGSIQRQKHYKNGTLHRDGDNPAVISVYRFADMNRYEIDLEYVRDDIWKYVRYSCIDRIELYYVNGKLHNKNGPAQIQYQNGAKQKEIWMQKGKRYRQNGLPTTVDYFSNGQIQEEVKIVE